MKISELEDIAEESGREAAADEYPYIQDPYKLSDERRKRWRRNLTRYARGRAQGDLYELRGKRARRFAQNWVIGYIANCALLSEHLEEEENEDNDDEEMEE